MLVCMHTPLGGDRTNGARGRAEEHQRGPGRHPAELGGERLHRKRERQGARPPASGRGSCGLSALKNGL